MSVRLLFISLKQTFFLRQVFNTLRVVFLSLAHLLLAAPSLLAQQDVVPALQEWTSKKGKFSITEKSSIVVDPAVFDIIKEDLDIFSEDLFTITKMRLPIRQEAIARHDGDIKFIQSPDASNQPEAYRLIIDGQLTVTASTSNGFFYAMQTILQSLVQSKDKLSLTRGTAYDFPAYKERGVMLDIGRKFFEVDYIKKTIRDLSWYKMNLLHLHFTEWHSFRLQSTLYPGLAAKESYSKKDIAEIESYAKKYHVIIVPEIDLPGHATAITNYNPNLGFSCASMREARWQGDSTNAKGQAWILDVTKPETKIWVKALLDEFIPLFNGPYFHIGGDEWQYDDQKEACPELMEATRKLGFKYPGDVIVNFMNEMNAHVKSRGKRSQMWTWWNYSPNEKQQNKYSVIPDKDVVINIWNAESMEATLKDGYKSVVTIESGEGALYITPGYGKKLGDYAYFDSKANYEKWQPSRHENVLGFKICIWADQAERMPSEWFDGYADFPKAILAERIWSRAASPTVDQFKLRVDKAKKASELFKTSR
ncbi:beta-N-acetylhexosaminidase [Chryseolinea sp. T2]|uniref:beta-N-acetylhexosaminidase n=1 Tax=Chryseolinea sp. T2 TaxID=3129255 RepID=UPI0030785EF8